MSDKRTILIIEDSPDDFEACHTALTRDNNLAKPIQWCRTGDEGLAYLKRYAEDPNAKAEAPCLVLLDLNLPGTDGRGVLAQIKSDAQLKRIPVIVMTSSRDEKDIAACYDEGANSYVVKPVDLDGFFAAIARLRDYWFEIVVLPDLK